MAFPAPIRLGVNIDHAATLRNARGGVHPDILRTAQTAIQAGADSITVHLREDRRHIRDADVELLKQKIAVPMNLEIAATPEMRDIALRIKPHAVCLVPEKRTEITTEGGLDVMNANREFQDIVADLLNAKINVAVFIEPHLGHVAAAQDMGIRTVEFHTGPYCHAAPDMQRQFAKHIHEVAIRSTKDGMVCHAGHGLNYENVGLIARIPEIMELNIGHFLIGEGLFTGLGNAIRHMRFVMDQARMAPDAKTDGA